MSLHRKEVFSPTSARFVIFALGATHFGDFQQIARLCNEKKFSTRDQQVLSSLHWAHHFLGIFSKVHEFVQNSVSSPRSASFVLFPLDVLLFSNFMQTARFCTKQPFQPDSSTFCPFALGASLFSDFQQSV